MLPIKIKTDALTDPEAEAALLWGVCQNPERFDDISMLAPEDFADRRYGSLYGDMQEALEQGRLLTNQHLIELTSRYEVDGEPLHRYLSRVTLGERLPSFADTARHLRDLSMLRKTRKAARALLEDVEAHEESLPQILDRHHNKLAELVDYSAATLEPYRYEQHTNRLIEIVQGKNEELAPIPFGIEALDRIIAGMLPGDYIAVAAPSGMGKSSFGGEVALNLALQQLGVLYVTAEMAGEQLAARNTSSLLLRNHGLKIPYAHMLTNRLPTGYPLEMVVREAMDWEKLPIQTIGARSGITVAEVARRAASFEAELRQEGKRLGLIVIDHIGLLASGNPRSGIYERTTEISGALAGLGRHLRVPMMVLAQVTKGVEKRGDGRARADDIRDTNAIRQDANIILTLHRPRKQIEDDIASTYIDGDMRRNPQLDTRISAIARDRKSAAYCAIAATLGGDAHQEFIDRLDAWVKLHDAFEIMVDKNRNGEGGFAGATIDIECNRIW